MSNSRRMTKKSSKTKSRPKNWIKKAFSKNKGALHRALKVPAGQKIPIKLLRQAVRLGGKTGKRAQLVLNLHAARRRKAKTKKRS